MGYKTYADKINRLAKQRISDYQKAVERFEKAEKQRNAKPLRYGFGVSLEYQIESQRADLEFKESKQALAQAKEAMQGALNEFDVIKNQMINEIRENHLANPKLLDRSVVDLLQSGICTPEEVLSMYRKAPNLTTQRYIGRYAGKLADDVENDPMYPPEKQRDAISRLRGISYEAEQATDIDQCPESQALAVIRECLSRTVENPSLGDFWDNLTENPMGVIRG